MSVVAAVPLEGWYKSAKIQMSGSFPSHRLLPPQLGGDRTQPRSTLNVCDSLQTICTLIYVNKRTHGMSGVPMFRFVTHEDEESYGRDWNQTQVLQPTAQPAPKAIGAPTVPPAVAPPVVAPPPAASSASSTMEATLAAAASSSQNAVKPEVFTKREPMTEVEQAKPTNQPLVPAKREVSQLVPPKEEGVAPKKKKEANTEEQQLAKKIRAAELATTKVITTLQALASQATEINQQIEQNNKWSWLASTPHYEKFKNEKKHVEQAKAAWPLVHTLLVNGNQLGHHMPSVRGAHSPRRSASSARLSVRAPVRSRPHSHTNP